ncbi:MAG: hypothetical protein KJO27_07555 [Gammaproteobacteria bacterium]|nr:hypothetical protein [Gammaproteobacteria bacterium]NNL45267.1 hypothetical protein [Woeseiaceae bacterium]
MSNVIKQLQTTLTLLMLAVTGTAWSDGTEQLGPASIPIASGSGIVTAGEGLLDGQPGVVSVDVPAGVNVQQVLLYWSGEVIPPAAATDTIDVSGNAVTGDFIGGFDSTGLTLTRQWVAYRADITGLGLVSSGPNGLSISGLNFDYLGVNNGAGIVVIYDDGSPAVIDLRDGHDHAYQGQPAPLDATVAQTFSFAPSSVDRFAQIDMFYSSVRGTLSGGGFRPSAFDITVAGVTTEFNNMLDSNSGEEWDTVTLSVPVPAGATDVTVQAFSVDRLGIGGDPASFDWLLASLVVRPEEPPTASLGDRVWEDLDRDGIQDCSDENMNGIIGDAGDSGSECGSGIPNIPVNLLTGDCETSLGQMVMTDMNGFYLFENLDPGDYCVNFGLPPEDFCDTDGFDLGAPVFTAMNAGDDAKDSDADPMSGTSDPTNLMAGETDRTIDAGIYCPAKIGDQVWFDDNENGQQDPGENGVPGVKTTLFECGPDMIAGTGDDIMTGEMRTTGGDGMYMYGGEPGVYDLPPGKYFVQFDPSTFPPGFDFTTPGVGPDALDSDCMPPDGITECTDLTASRSINLDRDCGLIPPPPPECNLFLDKSCRVEAPPPSPDFDKCSGKLQQFTLIWTGAGPITAAGPNNTVTVDTGDEATFVGPFSNNDVVVNISGAVNGQSVFHVSCSDEDFNDPSDCGKLSGNGKGNDSGLINDWRLEGFIDADGRVLDCTADSSEGGFSDNCSFEPQPLPSCDNGPKPDNLTWRYDGGTGGDGDCADSTFYSIVNEDGKLHTDFECTGAVDSSLQVTAVDDDGNVFLVNPGDSFTTLRDDAKTITLTDSNGDTQELVFHTSCSQPLEAQATAGAVTLAGLDDRDGAQDVTYRYELTNFGDPLSNVGIEDNPLGTIASGLSLGTDEMASFEKMAQIFGTTVNTAQASGTLANGDICAPSTAFDSVTVEAVIPPCSLSFELYKVEDKKLKIKITNNDTRDRTVTLQSLTVAFPAARGDVKKIKLEGDAYKRDDSSSPINGTPASFGPSDWTESDVSKRQIEAGKTETLEIETTDESSKDGRFEVSLDFGDGCTLEIVVENQQVQ